MNFYEMNLKRVRDTFLKWEGGVGEACCVMGERQGAAAAGRVIAHV